MPQGQLSAADQEIIDRLKVEWTQTVEAGIAPIRKQVSALMQRSSRAPGTGLDHAALMPASLSQQLCDNDGFKAFAKSVIGRNSSFVCELRMPTDRKAATPISGISPTEYVPRLWGPAGFPLRLRDIMPVLPVESGSVEYTMETSFTPSAAVVPETQLKPAMAITFAPATAKCATIAQFVKASRQSLMDVSMLQNWLNLRLAYSVNLKEEDVLVNGDPANAIQGLSQLATPFAYVPAAGDTGMDVVARAIGNLMGKGYSVDGLILNADDFTAMRLIKTTVGSYVFLGTASTAPDDEGLADTSMWSVPLVVSPSVAPGTFYVAAFQQSTILFSREVLTVEIAFQNEDDFTRNLVTIRGELRSGLAVPVPAGVLKGTLPAGSTQAVGGAISGPTPTRK
jgi:Phage capsid family